MINWPLSGNDYYVNLIEMDQEERTEALKEANKKPSVFSGLSGMNWDIRTWPLPVTSSRPQTASRSSPITVNQGEFTW
ncbi:MAG: hypothetical protein MZV63_42920 [Marinilabiliales bacterium]|nr:hypothetical protein [Marinilabiliales bacterium]